MAFEVEAFLGVCGFVVDTCDDLAFYVFFIRMSKMVVLLSCVPLWILFLDVGFVVGCVIR